MQSSTTTGRLYVVATPIGNLTDITLRALEVLRSVAVIACEDTRTSRRLLSSHQIHVPQLSFHQHTKSRDLQQILLRLIAGDDVAYISDAGTPGISDPGGVLVAAARAQGIPVIPIPGPSALTAALSVSGVDVSRFWYLGFFPQKKGRAALIKRIAETEEAVVFFESTHRIIKTLSQLGEAVALRPVIVMKELTKTFERAFTGAIPAVLAELQSDPKLLQGEFVVIVAPTGWQLPQKQIW